MFEAPGFVASLNDVAVMSEAVQECGSHLRVVEHGGPFAEGQVGRDDDRGALVESADQVDSSAPPDWENGR